MRGQPCPNCWLYIWALCLPVQLPFGHLGCPGGAGVAVGVIQRLWRECGHHICVLRGRPRPNMPANVHHGLPNSAGLECSCPGDQHVVKMLGICVSFWSPGDTTLCSAWQASKEESFTRSPVAGLVTDIFVVYLLIQPCLFDHTNLALSAQTAVCRMSSHRSQSLSVASSVRGLSVSSYLFHL